MTTYTAWLPGPDIDGEYIDPGTLWDVVIAQASTWTVASGGGAPAGTYKLAAITSGAGGQPYIALRYSNGVDNINFTVRFWAGLLGTLDPASWLGATHNLPEVLIQSNSYQNLVDAEIAPGPSNFATSILNGITGWVNTLTASGTLAATFTALLYSEGSRANTKMGYRMVATYNPNGSELSAGILQMVVDRVGLVSNADDGTVNVVAGGALLGEAVRSIPQVILEGGEAGQAWDDVQINLNNINQSIQNIGTQVLGDINIVTNAGDLNVPGHPATEPAAPTVEVYASPGVLTTIPTTPSLWNGMTTLPAVILAAAATVGRFISDLAGAGTVATGNLALTEATELAQTVNNNFLAQRAVEALEGIRETLRGQAGNPCENEGLADIVCRIEKRLESIEANQEQVTLRTRGTTVHFGPPGIEE